MKKLIYTLLLVFCTYAGYWVGQQTWIVDMNEKVHFFNTEEARLSEIKYCNALLEGLHYYYSQDTTFWNTEFTKTPEFKHINDANKGDWEDFFAPWDSPLK